jgi:hypothetical protein
MSKSRLPIPGDVVDEVLYRNDHTCCICNLPRKHVQIHHIDEDPSNWSIVNLAVVCLDCHSLVTGRQGLGRRYGVGEVRKYKRAWEQVVLYRRSKYRPPSRADQRELIGQIDVMICQILATRDDARRKELLEIIYNLHLWRGTPRIQKQIVEGFGHLAVMSGLSMPGLAKELAHKIWQICWHFVGPHQVRMDRTGASLVVQCADVTESLASFNCLMLQNIGVLRATLTTAENLFDVALWYKNERIARAVLKIYTEALRATRNGEPKDFPLGSNALRKSSRALARKVKSSGLRWPRIYRSLVGLGRRAAK